MPVVNRLDAERLHLSHGPIDLVLRAWGAPDAVQAAEAAALALFPRILPALAAELPALRAPLGAAVGGAVARRMVTACAAVAPPPVFITAMAAVAGAVADAVLAAMTEAAPTLRRAFVNNGGDIALHLAEGETLAIGMVADPDHPGLDGALLLRQADGIGGVATSGWRGRSFSRGIADAVTVLADCAALADAAATLIANAVDADSPAVSRRSARSLDPDSDLGARLVTVAVGPLTAAEVAAALDAGARLASQMLQARLIRGCALRLAGRRRLLGEPLRALAYRWHAPCCINAPGGTTHA